MSFESSTQDTNATTETGVGSATVRFRRDQMSSGAGVWFRADAHTVQYRLYCQMNDTLYTDGVLHQFEVAADAEVRPARISW
jgi:hypothetical protein